MLNNCQEIEFFRKYVFSRKFIIWFGNKIFVRKYDLFQKIIICLELRKWDSFIQEYARASPKWDGLTVC